MKKTLKRFILVSLVLAAVFAVSAFAEPVYYEADTNGEYSIDYDGNAGDYYALLVVEGVYTEEAAPVISEDTVQHIDQATADTEGVAAFAAFVPKTTAPGTVYVGGVQDGPVLLGYVNSEEISKPVSINVEVGDTVYLSNGSVVAIEQTGTYTVTEDGVVVVNSGMDSQKIYVIDTVAATATETAQNAVLGTKLLSIRSEAVRDDGIDYSGVRFKMIHNPDSRNVIKEYGFIMTVESNKVLNGAGADYTLDKAMVDSGYAELGMAWNKDKDGENGKGICFNSDDDYRWEITGVLHNIPLDKKSVKTALVSRPYAVYEDGTYVYGEITKTTLYEVCKSYEKDGFAGCSEEDIKFIKSVIELVEAKNIFIDISGLYPTN